MLTTTYNPDIVSLHISLVGRRDLSLEIYRQIRRAIVAGTLRHGDRLPATRELAGALSVARMTVTVAFERLAAEGLVTGRVGNGTFVSAKSESPAQTRRPPTAGALAPRHIWQAPRLPAALTGSVAFDFRTGIPDAGLFPQRTWRRLITEASAEANTIPTGYSDPAGHPELRAAIARHVGLSRGIVASVDDVTVTNGTQQALDVIARVLLAPGDRMVVEDPGYGPARWLFAAQGLRVTGVPVDEEGLVVQAIPSNVRAVYITPSHQYPLGVSMSQARRRALLAWATRHNAAVFEDDYDSEFRFTDRPLDPLHALDQNGRVIYIGSFSKTLIPGLRLGFVIAPQSLHVALRAAKFLSDWHSATAPQLALARFIDRGQFARHIRKVNQVYRRRYEMVTTLLARDFRAHLELIPSTTGLHVAALARTASVDRIETVARRAATAGVGIQTLSSFAAGRELRAGLVLGYGGIGTDAIEEGLRRLRACFGGSRTSGSSIAADA